MISNSVPAILSATTIGAISLNVLGSTTPTLTLEVVQTRVINTPPAVVWAVIGTFCDLPRWHTRTRRCKLLHEEGRTIRTYDLSGVGTLSEVQLDRDDETMTYSYALERGPWPIKQHRASLMVEPQDEGAVVTWRAAFRLHGSNDEGAVADIEELFHAGLAGLAREATR